MRFTFLVSSKVQEIIDNCDNISIDTTEMRHFNFFLFSYAIQIRQLLGGSLKNRKIDDDSKEAVRFGFLLVFSCFVVLIYS